MSTIRVKKQINLDEVKTAILKSSASTKFYIGSDSTRYKKDDVWYADYMTVVVLHIDGNKGCKVFGHIETERDYDQKKSRPSMRLMNEVVRSGNMYLSLAKELQDHEVEIHLDISPDEKNGSSCVVSEAMGYIRGVCSMEPMIKPNSFCASYCADRYAEIMKY